MFRTLSRSWEYAKISYGIIWDYKQLLIFPIVSLGASMAVMASFLLPLWSAGTLSRWMSFVGHNSQASPTTADQVWMYTVLFLFYFCSYFVITFFNAGLIACAMQVVQGREPSVGYGFSMASKRLPQILAWSLVSAVIGVLLKIVENANDKVGRIISAILGTGWTAMTFFVVPVLVLDGVGPFAAIKNSLGALRHTWGTAVVGKFSMGFLSILIMLPVVLVIGVLGFLAFSAGSTVGVILAIIVGIVLIVLTAAFTSAADVVFKALLYNYATGKTLPASVDRAVFRDAFGPKKSK